jgi:IstB-like ATP binding protein
VSTYVSPPTSLAMILRALKLPTISRHAEEIARQAERDGWTFERYLHHLVELEVHERRRRRIARHYKESDLPGEKTLATLGRGRLPTKVATILPTLCEGGFVERGENLLAFGLPGRGKTHLVCAWPRAASSLPVSRSSDRDRATSSIARPALLSLSDHSAALTPMAPWGRPWITRIGSVAVPVHRLTMRDGAGAPRSDA